MSLYDQLREHVETGKKDAAVAAGTQSLANGLPAQEILQEGLIAAMDVVGTLQAPETAGLRGQVRVLVGGAPMSLSWADEIGADGYAWMPAPPSRWPRSWGRWRCRSRCVAARPPSGSARRECAGRNSAAQVWQR